MPKAPPPKDEEAFRTISEVATELDMPQHVLRFWETHFTQIKPLKRGGSRRYYRPDDVRLLKGIRHLLYGEGYTIKGVQRILKERGSRFVATIESASSLPEGQDAQASAIDVRDFVANPSAQNKTPASPIAPLAAEPMIALKDVLAELLECKRLLDQTR